MPCKLNKRKGIENADYNYKSIKPADFKRYRENQMTLMEQRRFILFWLLKKSLELVRIEYCFQ